MKKCDMDAATARKAFDQLSVIETNVIECQDIERYKKLNRLKRKLNRIMNTQTHEVECFSNQLRKGNIVGVSAKDDILPITVTAVDESEIYFNERMFGGEETSLNTSISISKAAPLFIDDDTLRCLGFFKSRTNLVHEYRLRSQSPFFIRRLADREYYIATKYQNICKVEFIHLLQNTLYFLNGGKDLLDYSLFNFQDTL